MTGPALLGKRPRLRDDLLFSRPLHRGPATVHLVKDRRSGRAFELSGKERFLVGRLDGVRSLGEVGAEYAAAYGRRLGDDHWARLLWLLHQRDLLAGGATEPPVVPATRHDSVDRWARRLRQVLRPGPVAVLGVLVAALLAAVAWHAGPLWQAARPAFTDPLSLLLLGLLAWAGAATHEFAHALAAVRLGATVERINLVTLTCRIEDYAFLARRRDQLLIAAAGGLANGLVLLLVGAALAVVPGAFADRLFSAYVLVAAAQTLVNFVPIPPLDGYKMVSHLLDTLDLAPESRRYLATAPLRLSRRGGARYPRPVAIRLGLYGVWWFFVAVGTAAGVVYFVGALLTPALGALGHVLPAAVVGLTIAGWAARPRRARPSDRSSPPHQQHIEAHQRKV
ncbi:M50 family metallopeptidase [Micromonospora sp. WMMD998]|uniref:M50 family metallopeptidase n=1 Tax=Micromonospora sp. WMMD998 TaxID=3016092 RepID=UPI00249B3B2D|nr:M50 family metallopeptidase [Micromonospora sp. WMMD998]WFE39730.1 M50 family metallopeptidase [Micromonospora sp. WMMD998]